MNQKELLDTLYAIKRELNWIGIAISIITGIMIGTILGILLKT